MDEEQKTERVQLLMTPSEVKAIDDWSFQNRIRGRSEAIRTLVEHGLMLFFPNDICGQSGTYRCFRCEKTIKLSRGDRFPLADHHSHQGLRPDITRWELLDGEPENVATDTAG